MDKRPFLPILTALLILTSCNGGGGGPSASGGNAGNTGNTGGGGTTAPDPNVDPLSNYMWHILNTGQTYHSGIATVAGMDINLGNTHNNYKGRFENVVVSDGRIDLDHPDYVDRTDAADSANLSMGLGLGTNPTSNDDTDAHGTFIMGLIGAGKNNGIGIYGVAPEATLVGVNFLDSPQASSHLIKQGTLGGFGAITNMSWGYPTCQITSPDLEYIKNLRFHEHSISVTSAGNDFEGNKTKCGGTGTFYGNGNFDQHKSYPEFIVVAATNSQGYSATYSTPSSNTWISAPGGDVAEDGVTLMSTDLVGCNAGYATSASTLDFDKNANGSNPNCAYATEDAQGTSFAAPIVAGAIAVIKDACIGCKRRDIKHALAKTARKIHANVGNYSHPGGANLTGHVYEQGWITNAAGFNFHNWYGFGQLDVTAAIQYIKNSPQNLYKEKYTEIPGGGSFYSSGTVSLSIPDASATGRTSTINVNRHKLWIEHVQVRVNITHPSPKDLGIELTSPSGTVSKLMNINSNIVGSNMIDVTLGSNAFYGENSLGNWTIKVIDGASGSTGTITKWEIYFMGNKGPNAVANTVAPVTNLTNSGNTLNWTPSATGSIARYELCLRYGVASGCSNEEWFPIAPASSYVVSQYYSRGWSSLFSGHSYKVYIRAIDFDENESSVVEHTWTSP